MALDTVLVGVADTDEARADALISAATDIATPADASVVLFHAFTEEDFESSVSRLDFESASDADPDQVARRLGSVRRISSELGDAGLEVDVRGAVGDPGEEIVDAAERADADLIFVGGRGRSPTGKAVFGSTAQDVMIDSTVPVVYVRGE
jgi:nucleotide-binding universal stress UspA family protein